MNLLLNTSKKIIKYNQALNIDHFPYWKNLEPIHKAQIERKPTWQKISLIKNGLSLTALLFMLFNIFFPSPAFSQGITTRVSIDSASNEATDRSTSPSISGDGRMIVFASQANNLVHNDTNGFTDIFVHDRLTGETLRVSVDSLGNEANENSFDPTISQDGKVVAFRSVASNLDVNGPDTLYDVFIHNLGTGITTGIHASSFAEFNSTTPTLNANGRFVAFTSYETDTGITYPDFHLFLHDRQTNQTTQVTLTSDGGNADGSSRGAILSGNGQFLTFHSDATNLIANEFQGGIFVYDRTQAVITRAGLDSAGSPTNARGNPAMPAMSSDGQLIVFHSFQNGAFLLHDRIQGTTNTLGISGSNPSMSGDGRFIMFEDLDFNASTYVYLHDRTLNTTSRIDINSNGELGNFWFEGTAFSPTISADGKFVSYESGSTNLVPSDTNDALDIFVHERDGEVNLPQDLTVTLPGPGTGSVTSDYPGINCGTDCTEAFTSGLVVTLTATPDTGMFFLGWSGGCSGLEPCLIAMTQGQSVTANFEAETPSTHNLTVITTGTGTGTVSAPIGISCPGDCSENIQEGTIVTLIATADAEAQFSGWTGSGCSGTGACVVTMDQAHLVTATFVSAPSLTITTDGGIWYGQVSSNPSGIQCPSDCVKQYIEGTSVTLTATPFSSSSIFLGWTGGGCSGTGTCIVTMNQPETVNATFAPLRNLTVTINGAGSGTVDSNPIGISCPGDCTESFPSGTIATLTTAPHTGSVFNGWTGAGCSGTGSCVVTMNQAHTVTANFSVILQTLTMTKAGGGEGTVTTTPSGIDCGLDCAEEFPHGTTVTLNALADQGSFFGGWGGDVCGSGFGTVVMNQAVTCTGFFIPGETNLASVDDSGVRGNGDNTFPAISGDGRYIAFMSTADSLVANDTNGALDIFLRDQQAGTIERLSVDSVGSESDGQSFAPAISQNGQFVAFISDATNLVPNDTNGSTDVFIHDRNTGQTERVSVDSSGTEGNANNGTLGEGITSISADGRYVVFSSSATNLVANDTNAFSDIFLHDRQTGETARISVDSNGLQANGASRFPVISANGNYVAFSSLATNLVSGDTNQAMDVFVYDRSTGTTTRVSTDSIGVEANGPSGESGPGSLTADGTLITFSSSASNLVLGGTSSGLNVFLHNLTDQTTALVSKTATGVESNGIDLWPTISGDGRYIAFLSTATNLIPGTLDPMEYLYVFDVSTGEITLGNMDAFLASGGGPGPFPTLGGPRLSANGEALAFDAQSNNLLPSELYEGMDVFLHNQAGPTNPSQPLSISLAGSGQGSVTSSVVGIDCGLDCSENYLSGTAVVLTATPDPGFNFLGWTGSCTGTEPCTVVMTQVHTVTATFELPPPQTLSVTVSGMGSGAVTSIPAGIFCPDDCIEDFPHGTAVILGHIVNAGSIFTGWNGACSGTGVCVVTMSQAQNVTATFDLLPVLSVTLNGSGAGSVTSSPSGISCPGDCTEPYANGTLVTLTATPNPGSIFEGWSGGGCSGTGTCLVTMSQAQSVTATFTSIFALNVLTGGAGTGTVTSSPAGISCPTDCVESYISGTVVTLTAIANGGSAFIGWSGEGCSGIAPCSVTMNQVKAVTATFEPLFALAVSTNGNGSGTISSVPVGISCPGDCTETYLAGTLVTLTAIPNLGSTFDGWAGSCSGLGECIVTMNQVHNVTATFGSGPDFHTQIVKMTIPPNSQSVTVTAPTSFDPVDPAHTVALISGITQHAMGWTEQKTQDPNEISARVELTDGSTLTATRSASLNQSDTVWVLLMEYVGQPGGPNEFVVRDRRTHSWNSGQTLTSYGPITSVGDFAKTVVFASGVENPNSRSNQFDRGDVRAWVNGTKIVQLVRGDGSGAIESVHQVVEFIGANWTIQSGDTTPNPDPGGTDATLISVGDVSTAWVYFTWSTNSANLDERGHRVWLTSPTNLRIQEDAKASGSKTVRWFVIQNPQLTVQSGSAEDQFNSSLSATINGFTGVADVSKAFAWVTGLTDGGGNAHPRDMWQFELADDSTIALQRGYSGQELSYRYQVIELP